MAQLEGWRDELRQGGNVLHSMFETGQALLLSSLRFLSPRSRSAESRSTATRYESFTAKGAANPRTQTGRRQAALVADPCPRTVRIRVQSTPASATAQSVVATEARHQLASPLSSWSETN